MAAPNTSVRCAEDLQPFAARTTYDSLREVPYTCAGCTITFTEGKFRVKFVNRLCPVHGKLADMQVRKAAVFVAPASTSAGANRARPGSKTRTVPVPKPRRGLASKNEATGVKKGRISGKRTIR